MCVRVCTLCFGYETSVVERETGNNNCGWIRGKNGVNGKLKICDEISEARSETNEPKPMVQTSGFPGSQRRAALG